MILIVNGSEVEYKSLTVDVDINEITRQFCIINNEKDPVFEEGDKVTILNNDRVLLLEGDIEYVKMNSETKKEYIGRNKARYIVDCYSDKTIQFSEGLTLQSVLVEVAAKFGLKVIGEAKMPKETLPKIEVGEMYGDSFMDIIESAGQIITSDAYGNIIIEDDPEEKELQFVYGDNIRSRDYEIDGTTKYDRYIVLSQSSYEKLRLAKKTKIKVSNKGEFGSGEFIKVIKSKDALTEDECKEVARKEYEKDHRKSIKYTVEVDNEYEIDVNKTYMVIDEGAKINERLRVQSFSMSRSEGEDNMKIRLESMTDE